MSVDDKSIIKLFLIWRVVLFVFLFLAISTLPLQFNFLGGGVENYLQKPYLWSWINFDGEHFLSIAYRGYRELEYFFFPGYPLLVGLIAKLLNGSIADFAFVGLLVSNLSFVIGLVGLTRLIRLDYKKEIAVTSIVLLLLFPTSFYFGSFYSEGLFFALTVWSFYFARKGKWLLAGVLGAGSTATRFVGIALFPALVLEALMQWRENKKLHLIKPILASFSVLLGLIVYTSFLGGKTGDPLDFFHSVEIFGQQRTAGIVMLPQVFYRYLFKIIPNIDYSYFPAVFTTWLELLVAVSFGVLALLGLLGGLGLLGRFGKVKLRISYGVYLALVYLIPTFSGSFSSLPRYVLVAFPAFILLALYLNRLPKALRILFYVTLFVSLALATSLFTRGYWIA